MRLDVDVVIPCFNERPAAIAATLGAVRTQTHRPASVTVVDDASAVPVAEALALPADVTVLRQSQNAGISAARNRGAAAGAAPVIAFVNIDVLPSPDWLEACVDYLAINPGVGLVWVETVPSRPERLHARWRMLVQEIPVPPSTGRTAIAVGHVLVLRREAFEQVGGFDPRFRLAAEDQDLSWRLAAAGWEVHFLKGPTCTSIQEDTSLTFAHAEYKRFCVVDGRDPGFLRATGVFVQRFAWRCALHVARGRPMMLLIEPLVLVQGVRLSWQRVVRR